MAIANVYYWMATTWQIDDHANCNRLFAEPNSDFGTKNGYCFSLSCCKKFPASTLGNMLLRAEIAGLPGTDAQTQHILIHKGSMIV